MGMLTGAFLQGAGQGLNVLGQSMQRDLDRQDEQSMWERRTQLLGEIQRENATVQREDQAAFEDKRFPVRLDQERQTTTARGEAQTAVEVARATNPELIAAQDEAARKATQRDIDALVQKANNPDLTAAERRAALTKLEDLKAEVKIRGDGAIRVANATRVPKEGAKSVSDQLAEKEKALGRPLTTAEREALVLGAKADNGNQALRVKQAEEAATKAIETGSLKPEDRAKFVRAQLDSYGEFEARAQTDELLRTERSAGNVARFIDSMRKQGADDAALLKLGVTKAELKQPATGPDKGAAARRGDGAAKVPQDVVGNQPIGMLTRQTDIEESARAGNKRAIEYLRRQEAGRLQNNTAPRDAASLMNG